ncbi:hypothetical protein F5Y05DRAFT_129175 [Hypoxylon sp. FL0543]|nr:hypothetical protein F5Y05DRAFT_129175 [Hypoxylon sp. FL0543]
MASNGRQPVGGGIGATSQSRPNQVRSPVLSNSAVEFLETRPQQAFGSEVAQRIELHAPQYVTEIDKFVSTSDLPEPDYFKESEEKMVRFKSTLSKFCKTLEERKLGKKLNIAIKESGDYNIQDVLRVAKELQLKHLDDQKGYLGKIRHCFRRLVKHRGVLHSILSFLPNDTYSAPICGGFTMILAAVDRAEDLREEICNTLAEIPIQLEQVNATIDIHRLSRELKRRADSVFVAIFELLESIIQELSKNLAKKTILVTLKGEHYGDSINTAIEKLRAETKAFEREAQLCDSKRLGRMEEHTMGIKLTVEDSTAKQTDFYERYEEDNDHIHRKLDELPSVLVTALFNRFYSFYASNPSFNARDGTIDRAQVTKGGIAYSHSALKQITSPAIYEVDSPEDRRAFASKWLHDTMLPSVDSLKDVKECLDDLEMLSLREKDTMKWIIESDEIKSWLTAPDSRTLAVEPDTPPQDLLNSTSAASAFLSQTISTSTDFPVLTYMGGLKTNDNPDEVACGSIAMVRSLIAQLLLHIAEHRPDVDLEFLKSKRFRQESPKTLSRLAALFCRLLDRLSEDVRGNVVFIIIDSISRFQGSMEDAATEVLQFLDTIEQSDTTMKVLLTDLGPPLLMEIQERGIAELSVPDNVDGGKHDLNVEVLDADTSLSIVEFETSQRRSNKGNDSDRDDQSEVSSSEDEYSAGN